MTLTLKFLRALMPCVVAGVQALVPVSGAGAVEDSAYQDIIAPPTIELIHKQPVAQMTYADYRRRLMAARTDVEMATAMVAVERGIAPVISR